MIAMSIDSPTATTHSDRVHVHFAAAFWEKVVLDADPGDARHSKRRRRAHGELSVAMLRSDTALQLATQ
jgi:hypothetical protein